MKTNHIILLSIITISFIFQKAESSDLNLLAEIALKKSNPELFKNDVLISTNSDLYPGFFPYLLIPFLSLGNFYLWIRIVIVFLKIVFILSIYSLSKEIFSNDKVALISALACVFSKSGLDTEFGCNSFIPRIVSLLLIIIAFYFILKQRYYVSFFILGISTNIHPLSTIIFTFILLFGLVLFHPKNEMIKKLVISLLLFLIVASPVIVNRISSPHPFQPSSQEHIMLRIPHPFLNNSSFPIKMLWFLPFLTLFFIGMLYKKKSNLDKLIFNCSILILMIIFGNYIFFEVLNYTFLAPFQLYRLSVFLILFSILYGAWLSYFYFIRKNYLDKIIAISIIFLLTFFPFSDFVNFPKRTIFSRDEIKQAWIDVQLWAKMNTEINDLFITPPDYEGFRIYSERGIIGSWKDGGDILISKNYYVEWWERMEDLGYKKSTAIFRWFGEEAIWYPLQELWIKIFNIRPQPVAVYGYDSLTERDFMRISKKYNASYVVIKKPNKLNFMQVHENKYFRVYKL